MNTYCVVKDIAAEVAGHLFEGGAGSGNWGHRGRPGKRGGSAQGGGGRISAHVVGGERRVYSRDMAIAIKNKGFTSAGQALDFIKEKYPGQPGDRYGRALVRAGLKVGVGRELALIPKAAQVGGGQRPEPVFTKVASILKTAKVENVKHLGGGVTPTFKADIDGVRGVLKAMDNRARNEIAAYEINMALGFGIVPPVVKRVVDIGRGKVEDVSIMHFVEGQTAAMYSGKFKYLDMAKITAFDFVIGNQDRHPDNFLVDKNGKTWAIDNALSMGKASRVVSATIPMVESKPIPGVVKGGLQRLVGNRASLEPKIASILGSKAYAKGIFDRASELVKMSMFPRSRYSFYRTWKNKHGGFTPEKAKSLVGEALWLRRLCSTSTTLQRINRSHLAP